MMSHAAPRQTLVSRQSLPLWLSAGVLAVVLGLSAFAGAALPPEQTKTLSGDQAGVTPAFQLEGGYYRLTRRVTSEAEADCFFQSELQTADGSPKMTIDGPAVQPGSAWTWQTDMHVIAQGSYRLQTLTACGNWQVTVAPQQTFDIEGQPIEVTSWGVGPGDIQAALDNRASTDVTLDGWALAVRGSRLSLPGGLTVPAHATLIVHVAAGQSSASDLFLDAGDDLINQALQAPIDLAVLNAQGTAVSQFTMDTPLPPVPSAAVRAATILNNSRATQLLGS